MERKEKMRDTIVNLNLPQEAKEFLLKTKIEEDEFEYINIKFFSEENGFLCDVVEWTKINDLTLKDLNEDYVEEFLGELEKFRDYHVIAENLDSGNLIAMQEGTGEIYELEHEVIEEIVTYFVNSSFPKAYESMNYFKEIKDKVLRFRKQESVEKIQEMFERDMQKFILIDSKVVIDGNENNKQFWNGVLFSFKEWCFD